MYQLCLVGNGKSAFGKVTEKSGCEKSLVSMIWLKKTKFTNRHTIVGTWPPVQQVSTSSDPKTSGNRMGLVRLYLCHDLTMSSASEKRPRLGLPAGVDREWVVETAIACASVVGRTSTL